MIIKTGVRTLFSYILHRKEDAIDFLGQAQAATPNLALLPSIVTYPVSPSSRKALRRSLAYQAIHAESSLKSPSNVGPGPVPGMEELALVVAEEALRAGVARNFPTPRAR